MSIYIIICISISIFIYISISIIIFSLVVKFAGGEEPKLMGFVLKLFIVYERYGWEPESKISSTKGANWIFQRRHSLGRGKSRFQIFLFCSNVSSKFKMFGW